MGLLHAAAFGLWAAFLFTSSAHADEPVLGLKATGLVGAQVADGAGHYARFAVETPLNWTLPSDGLRIRERVRWLELQGDRRTHADVLEMTAAWRRSEVTFTVGAQQLYWGRREILRVTDVINPADQHDLFFEDLPEAKLALWMENLEWQSGSQTLQVIATPQVPVDRFHGELSGLPAQVSKPSPSLANATLAVRYGFEWLGWSADIMAVRGRQASPALRPVVDATGLRLQGAMSRQNSIGFSADKSLGSTVLRLEGLNQTGFQGSLLA